MKVVLTWLIMIIGSSCYSQKTNLLIKIDSLSDMHILKKDSTIDFFYIGKDEPSIKSALPRSSFWLRTSDKSQSQSSVERINFKKINVQSAGDSVVLHSWDFLRRHDFFVHYKINEEYKIYKVIQKAAFYSEE